MSRPADSPGAARLAFDGESTPVKTALFLVVCLAWLLPGLVGREPWKTDEAIAFGVVTDLLRSSDWLVPTLSGTPYLDRPPLYYWTSAILARLFGGLLPLADAARLATGLFVALAMAGTATAAVALYGARAGRIGVLLLIGCLGLLLRAHEMNTAVAGLAGVALAIAGLAHALARPRLGGALAGLGLGIAFLADGAFPAFLIVATAAALPLASRDHRSRAYGIAALLAIGVAAPMLLAWPLALAAQAPEAFAAWRGTVLATRWSAGADTRGVLADLAYFPRTLPWYAWPALPLAAWTLWRARRRPGPRPELRLPAVATGVFLAATLLLAESREVNAMPLLVPLALLGIAELDSLPRGAASALDWFGVMTFALFALLLWAAYAAVFTGYPTGAARWVARHVPGYRMAFDPAAFALALGLTVVWIAVVARSLRTTRRAVVNWTAGITMVWMLAMALGLPVIDQARSYREVSARVKEALAGSTCTLGVGVGDAQRALVEHYAGIRLVRPDDARAAACETLLAQVSAGRVVSVEEGRWRETWRGSRPGDRVEAFAVFRRLP